MILRHLVEADRLKNRFAIDQRPAAGAERQSDPGVTLGTLAVSLGQVEPAAIALADIVGDVGEFHELVDVDAGLLGEFGRVGAEYVFVGLHEADRPQHAKACAFFDGERRSRDVGRLDVGCGLGARASRRQRRGGNAQDKGVTTGDVVPHASLPVFRSRR